MLKDKQTRWKGEVKTLADAKHARQKLIAEGLAAMCVPKSPVKSSGGGSMAFAVRGVPVDAVRVVGMRRALNTDKVRALKASIGQIGLRTPITVQKQQDELILLAGLHRVEAARQLGWKTIPCFLMEGDEEVLPWRIIENLHRAELTALERAEHIEEIRALIQIRARGEQLAPPGGQQPSDVGINKTAEALGLTREEIRRAKEIASMAVEAKAEARKLGLDDNQSSLLKIARLPTSEAQLSALREVDERTRQPRVRRAHAVPATRTDEKAAARTETLQSHAADTAEASKSGAIDRARGGAEVQSSRVATTTPSTGTAPEPDLDLPYHLDRCPLSPEDAGSLAALTHAWEEASNLKLAWAKASTRAREKFIDEIQRR